MHCFTVAVDVVVNNEEVEVFAVVVEAPVVVVRLAFVVVVVTPAAAVVVVEVAHGTLQLRGHEATSLGVAHVRTTHSDAS